MAIANDGTSTGADGSWFQTYYQNVMNPQPVIPIGNGANVLNPVAQAAQIAAQKKYNSQQAAVASQLAKIRAQEQANLRAKLAEQQRLLNERNLQRLNELNNNQTLNPWDPSVSLGGPKGGTSNWFSEYMGNANVAGKPYATGVNITHADELLLGKGNVLKENREEYLSKQDPKKAASKAAEFKRADNVDAMLESALADPTIDDATKAQYQKIRDTIVYKGDTAALELQLHNAATTSAYRRAIGAWQNKTAQGSTLPGLAGPTGAATGMGGFYGDPGFDVDNLQESDLDKAPNIVLERDATGRLYIRKTDQAALAMFGTLKKNPAYAAQMIIKLAAWGAYGGGSEKYAAQRIKFDSKGRPIAATWNVDDQKALDTFIKETSRLQAAGETTPWNELLDQVSTTNSTIAASAGYGAAAGGGGGGGYGGGGGASTGISFTPPDLLKQTINGIARSRLGQVLSDTDVAQFVADFHAKEAAFVNARVAGLDGTQVDAESAAAAWIESRFRDQQASMAGNNLISDLAKFLMGGGMSAGASN